MLGFLIQHKIFLFHTLKFNFYGNQINLYSEDSKNIILYENVDNLHQNSLGLWRIELDEGENNSPVTFIILKFQIRYNSKVRLKNMIKNMYLDLSDGGKGSALKASLN